MNTKRNLLGLMGAAALTPLLLGTGAGRAAGGLQGPVLPNPTLQDHDGRKLKFYDDVVRGKIVVINMMYTVCSGICPGNTANLMRVQEMLGGRVGRDIFMVSLTLRPGFDTPAALHAYRVSTRGWCRRSPTGTTPWPSRACPTPRTAARPSPTSSSRCRPSNPPAPPASRS